MLMNDKEDFKTANNKNINQKMKIVARKQKNFKKVIFGYLMDFLCCQKHMEFSLCCWQISILGTILIRLS